MKRFIWRLLLPVLAIATLAVPTADAQRRWGDFRENQWEIMDDQQVRPGTQSMILSAAGRSGSRYTAIRFRVLGEPIFVNSLTILYGNGSEEDRPIRRVFQAGESSTPIDLEGGARFIRAIRLNFRQDPDWRRTARVVLLGDKEEARRDLRPVPPRIPIVRDDIPRNWVRFGSQRADFGGDRDVVQVGRERGRFDKIALRVRGNDVYVRDIIVRFGNGETQDFFINQVIQPEQRTQELRLERTAYIETIEVTYASRPTGRVEAIVDFYGEYAQGSNFGAGEGHGSDRGWVLVGAKKASMLQNDNDEYPIGERGGRISALRLLARRSDVEIRSITVAFANGEIETINVGRLLRRDEASPDLVFRGGGGGGRVVRGITVNHKSVLSLRGEAVVEIWARR